MNVEEFDVFSLPVIGDVFALYSDIREDYTPSQLVKIILENNANELADEDDAPLVYLGIAAAAYHYNDYLPAHIKKKVLAALSLESLHARFRHDKELYDGFLKWLGQLADRVNGVKVKKERKRYKIYRVSQWQPGECFRCVYTDLDDQKTKTVYFRVIEQINFANKMCPVVNMFANKGFTVSVSEATGEDLEPLYGGFDVINNTVFFHFRHLILGGKVELDASVELEKITPPSELPHPVDEYVVDSVYYSLFFLQDIQVGVKKAVRRHKW